MCCGKEGVRIILWMSWVTNMLITSIYYILSFVTASNLIKSYKLLLQPEYNVTVSNDIWRAPVAAAVLGGLLVLLFNILSCAILIRKSIDKRGPGFGYGFIVAMCFTLAFFGLLCGLVLDGFKDTVTSLLEANLSATGAWTSYSTGAYVATTAFAYICFCMFILFCLALVIFQGAVSDELGIGGVNGGAASNPYAKMADPAYGQHGGLLQGKAIQGLTIPAGGIPAALDPHGAALV